MNLLAILTLADGLATLAFNLYERVKALPAEGTPEDQAEIERLKAKLAAQNTAVQTVPVLDAEGRPEPWP